MCQQSRVRRKPQDNATPNRTQLFSRQLLAWHWDWELQMPWSKPEIIYTTDLTPAPSLTKVFQVGPAKCSHKLSSRSTRLSWLSPSLHYFPLVNCADNFRLPGSLRVWDNACENKPGPSLKQTCIRQGKAQEIGFWLMDGLWPHKTFLSLIMFSLIMVD